MRCYLHRHKDDERDEDARQQGALPVGYKESEGPGKSRGTLGARLLLRRL